MKKPKKAIPEFTCRIVREESFQFQCPHYKVYFRYGINRSVLVKKCDGCGEVVHLVWEKSKEVEKFS